jgi:DNA-binding MarR family transcriptional regulator
VADVTVTVRKVGTSKRVVSQAIVDELRTYQRAVDLIDELVAEHLGIHRTDARCLDLLEHHGRMTAGQLAHESGLTTGATTAVIDRLEAKGLVVRVRDDRDRRKVHVEASVRCHELCSQLYGPLVERAEHSMARRTRDELAIVLSFLREARLVTEGHAAWLREHLPGVAAQSASLRQTVV